MKNSKIGILGSGPVALTLADGLIKYGATVKIGTSNPAKLVDWLDKAGDKASAGSFEEAAQFGQLILVAVKGLAFLSVLEAAGSENLAGKTVIDANNPIENTPPVNGALQLFTTQNKSLMEQAQAAFPEAHFVKAFNSMGAGLMVNPDFGGVKPTMFICGNSAEAKAEVSQICELFGYETEDMGSQELAGAIEALCILWCAPGFLKNEWTNHAFKLLKR